MPHWAASSSNRVRGNRARASGVEWTRRIMRTTGSFATSCTLMLVVGCSSGLSLPAPPEPAAEFRPQASHPLTDPRFPVHVPSDAELSAAPSVDACDLLRNSSLYAGRMIRVDALSPGAQAYPPAGPERIYLPLLTGANCPVEEPIAIEFAYFGLLLDQQSRSIIRFGTTGPVWVNLAAVGTWQQYGPRSGCGVLIVFAVERVGQRSARPPDVPGRPPSAPDLLTRCVSQSA